jgi:hypothetical protein
MTSQSTAKYPYREMNKRVHTIDFINPTTNKVSWVKFLRLINRANVNKPMYFLDKYQPYNNYQAKP